MSMEGISSIDGTILSWFTALVRTLLLMVKSLLPLVLLALLLALSSLGLIIMGRDISVLVERDFGSKAEARDLGSNAEDWAGGAVGLISTWLGGWFVDCWDRLVRGWFWKGRFCCCCGYWLYCFKFYCLSCIWARNPRGLFWLDCVFWMPE